MGRKCDRNGGVRTGCRIRLAVPFRKQLLRVNIRQQQAVRKWRRFYQKFSLFCDETMAGKNVVSGGFPLSGFCPNDCTGVLSGKALGDQPAIGCLPHHFASCAGTKNHQRGIGFWGISRPSDGNRKCKGRPDRISKYQIAKRNGFFPKQYRLNVLGSWREETSLGR